MLQTRFREYALAGAIFALSQLILFVLTDSVWGTAVLSGSRGLIEAWFSTNSRAFENFLTVVLGGLGFAALFVLGVFIDQLNALHFAWEMGSFEKRTLKHSWVRQLVAENIAYLGLDADDFLKHRKFFSKPVNDWWRNEKFRFWRLLPAMYSHEQNLHDVEKRRRIFQWAGFLDFLQSYVLGKDARENSTHVLGLIERWRLCRTIGTVIAFCGIEHALIVFYYVMKTNWITEHPIQSLF